MQDLAAATLEVITTSRSYGDFKTMLFLNVNF